MKNTLSIVIPCYNEESVIKETLRQMDDLVREIRIQFSLDTEVILVNDGSSDRTLEILLASVKKLPFLRVVNFARNFGHQIAVTAGMDASRGDAVVLMDADLQDPPPIVLQMVKKWKEEDYDVVYATRLKRPGETVFKKISAQIFYRILNSLSDTSIPLDTGDFRLMSRRVVEVLNASPEKDRFIRGMVSWVGFKQVSLPYQRSKRFAGETHYPLKKMLALAFTGIMSFSTKPLRLASLLGLFTSLVAFMGLFYALAIKLFTDTWISGWTSLILSILFLGGVQLLCMGILGEYIGRIYMSSKNRPLYLVEGFYGYNHNSPHFSRSPVGLDNAGD